MPPHTPKPPSPTNIWPMISPEDAGLDSSLLARLVTTLREEPVNQHYLLLIRGGRTILEAAYTPYHPAIKHEIHSVTKSILSMLFGIALERGYIQNLDQCAVDSFGGRRFANPDDRKAGITLAHLLMMNSGLDWPENEIPYGLPQNMVRRMYSSPDPVQFILDRPMAAAPGKRFNYNSGGSHLLSIILAQSIRQTLLDFARQALFEPLGITDFTWAVDSLGNPTGGGGLQLRPLDLAKLGVLYLQGGRWQGKQVVPEEWVRLSTSIQTKKDNPPHYGYHWWVYPFGAYSAVGFGDQHIFVFPNQDMVAVTLRGMNRSDPTRTSRHVETLLLPAVKASTAISPNPQGGRALQTSLRAAQRPQPQPVLPLPAIAVRVQGRFYDLEANERQLRHFSLRFDGPAARLMLANIRGAYSLPVGLDGRYRSTTTNPECSRSPCACRGAWSDERTIIVEQQILGAANHTSWTFQFEQDRVEVRVTPFNGLSETITGRARIEKLVHITSRSEWETAQQKGVYRADSLDSQGFIHLSRPGQAAGSANRFFRGQTGLVLLWIDTSRVKPEILFENLEGGQSLFPHLYGPLDLNAVIEAAPLEPQADGRFGKIRLQ